MIPLQWSLIDIETNGVSAKRDCITEIAIITIENWRIVETWSTYKNPNTEGIKNAAKLKREETIQKVLDAIALMEKESIPINFNSLSKFSGVTKAWLYKQPDLKDMIAQKRKGFNNMMVQDQILQINKLKNENTILIKQNKSLRDQIEELRKQLEVAFAKIYKNTDI